MEKLPEGVGGQVLLVNNASRWEFEEQSDGQWSDCLFAGIDDNWVRQYVVWVDDTVFGTLHEFSREKYVSVRKRKWVQKQAE